MRVGAKSIDWNDIYLDLMYMGIPDQRFHGSNFWDRTPKEILQTWSGLNSRHSATINLTTVATAKLHRTILLAFQYISNSHSPIPEVSMLCATREINPGTLEGRVFSGLNSAEARQIIEMVPLFPPWAIAALRQGNPSAMIIMEALAEVGDD